MVSVYYNELNDIERDFIKKQIKKHHAIIMSNNEIYWIGNYYNDFNKSRNNIQKRLLIKNEDTQISDNLFINLIINLFGFCMKTFNNN
jgi:hypothetical protein